MEKEIRIGGYPIEWQLKDLDEMKTDFSITFDYNCDCGVTFEIQSKETELAEILRRTAVEYLTKLNYSKKR